jgi:hypothetical protein
MQFSKCALMQQHWITHGKFKYSLKYQNTR